MRKFASDLPIRLILATLFIWSGAGENGLTQEAPPVENKAHSSPNEQWMTGAYAVLEDHCLDCHSESDPQGGVNLEAFYQLKDARPALQLWRRVQGQMALNQMPPPKKGSVSPEEKAKVFSWIEENERYFRDGKVLDPGTRRMRRLTRNEYSYAVRDLLGTQNDLTGWFPADGGGGEGFNNHSDTLFIAPSLMEKYLDAAEAALQEVFQDENLTKALIHPLPSESLLPEMAARENLRRIMRLAFRRPIQSEDEERYVKVYQNAAGRGLSHAESMGVCIKALLCSPSFLFLKEKDQDGEHAWKISDLELATRISFFLWSSIPDDALLRAAEENRLRDPEELEKQVRRMLADPRAESFARHFGGQWLEFEKVLTHSDPDRQKYQINDRIRQSMFQESLQFVDHVLRGEGNFLDLLNSNYTFLNQTLAKFYGVEGVEGDDFRRVPLLAEHRRGGLIGMGAVLTATSLPRRTSPVLRGKWILEQIMGTPVPAPPPNVGELAKDDREVPNRTLRQQLEAHLRREDCIGCHARMDPAGFALENYDAVGRWRDSYGETAIDTSATMPDGSQFNGVDGLKEWMMKERGLFVSNVCRKLLGFALNRDLEAYDSPTLNQMEKTLESQEYRAFPVIMTVIQSYPFQHRRIKPTPIPEE